MKREVPLGSPRVHTRAEMVVSAGHSRDGLHALSKNGQKVDPAVQTEMAPVRSVCDTEKMVQDVTWRAAGARGGGQGLPL